MTTTDTQTYKARMARVEGMFRDWTTETMPEPGRRPGASQAPTEVTLGQLQLIDRTYDLLCQLIETVGNPLVDDGWTQVSFDVSVRGHVVRDAMSLFRDALFTASGIDFSDWKPDPAFAPPEKDVTGKTDAERAFYTVLNEISAAAPGNLAFKTEGAVFDLVREWRDQELENPITEILELVMAAGEAFNQARRNTVMVTIPDEDTEGDK